MLRSGTDSLFHQTNSLDTAWARRDSSTLPVLRHLLLQVLVEEGDDASASVLG